MLLLYIYLTTVAFGDMPMLNEKTIGDQIIKSSITIATISNLDPHSSLTINTPILIGGESLIKDADARLRIEQRFGQINILDLFMGKQYVLKSASYFSEPIEELSGLVPNIYLVKVKYEDTYLLSLLITPYSDINLTEFTDELNFIGRSYHGTFRRTAKQLELGQIDDMKRRAECTITAETLISLLHYRIFNLRRLRGGVDSPHKQSYFSLVMFMKGRILNEGFLCIKCNTMYPSHDISDDKKCPKCGEPLVKAPPNLNIESIAFGFPDAFIDFASKVNLHPLDYLTIYTVSMIPPAVKIAVHNINPHVFSSVLTLPRRAIFDIVGSNDLIDLYSLWSINNDEINMIIAFSDSRLEGYDLPTYMNERVFIRDLSEGIAKGVSYEETFRKSVTKEWNLSRYFSLKELDENASLNTWTGVKNECL